MQTNWRRDGTVVCDIVVALLLCDLFSLLLLGVVVAMVVNVDTSSSVETVLKVSRSVVTLVDTVVGFEVVETLRTVLV